MTIGVINARTVPVYPGIAMFTKIANSMAKISRNGRLIDLNTKKMIRKTSPIETQLTTLKS